MVRKPKTEQLADTATSTGTGTATAVDVQQQQSAPFGAQAYADPTGSVLRSEEAIARAIEAAREMAMSFVEYTKPEVIFEKSNAGSTFTVMDCVTVLINDTDPKSKTFGGQKPVHVFQLEEDLEGNARPTYFVMLGVNPVRDRIASGFFNNRLTGVALKAGPVKMVQIPTRQPNPAWSFATTQGFRIVQRDA